MAHQIDLLIPFPSVMATNECSVLGDCAFDQRKLQTELMNVSWISVFSMLDYHCDVDIAYNLAPTVDESRDNRFEFEKHSMTWDVRECRYCSTPTECYSGGSGGVKKLLVSVFLEAYAVLADGMQDAIVPMVNTTIEDVIWQEMSNQACQGRSECEFADLALKFTLEGKERVQFTTDFQNASDMKQSQYNPESGHFFDTAAPYTYFSTTGTPYYRYSVGSISPIIRLNDVR
jgi:hypothetical protein